MAYGIEIWNRSNDVVIDGMSPLLQKIRTGVLAHSGDGGDSFDTPWSHRARFFNYTASAPNSLLFMQPAIGQLVTAPTRFTMNYLEYPDPSLRRVWSNSTQSIPFMEVSVATDLAAGAKPSHGLEIYAADGTLLFHPGREVLAADDYYSIGGQSGSGTSDMFPGNPYREMPVVRCEWLCPLTAAPGRQRYYTPGGEEGSFRHSMLGAVCRVNVARVGWNVLSLMRRTLPDDGAGYFYPGVPFFTA